MDETTLRMYVELLLHEMGRSWADPVEADTVRRTLRAALARPPGPATHRELLDALRGTPRVRDWMIAAQRHKDTRQRLMIAAAEDGIPARYLTAEYPEQVAPGREIGVEVTITRAAADGRSSPLQSFAVPPEGVHLRLKIRGSDGLEPVEDLLTVRVPADGDSEPRLFVLSAVAPGTWPVTVRAYLDGRPVGEHTMVIRVGTGTGTEPVRRSAGITTLRAHPGDLTLQIDGRAAGYRCTLFHSGATATGVVREVPARLVGTVRNRLAEMMAHPESHGLMRKDLRALGRELWSAALPTTVRQRFDDLMSEVRSLSVVMDRHYDMPWELLLRAPETGRDTGFLAESVPVLRRVDGQAYQEVLRVRDAAYVDPGAGEGYGAREIADVRRLIGARVTHRTPPFDSAEELLHYVEAGDFGLLHLACHSNSPPDGWQTVLMTDGALRAYHLEPAAQQNPPALARRRPLIFFNACGSADKIAATAMPAWAERFLRAGAGAFVGSAWEIRSSLAGKFARTFYAGLVEQDRVTVGEASLRARQRMADSPDPTWLAYAVYADVNAVVTWS